MDPRLTPWAEFLRPCRGSFFSTASRWRICKDGGSVKGKLVAVSCRSWLRARVAGVVRQLTDSTTHLFDPSADGPRWLFLILGVVLGRGEPSDFGLPISDC